MSLLVTIRIAAAPKTRLLAVAAAVEFDCLGLKSSSTRSGWSRSSSSKEISSASQRRRSGSKENARIVNISGPAGD